MTEENKVALKQEKLTHLDITVNGRQYKLHCDLDSPLGEMHDAIMELKSYVVERMVKAHKDHEVEVEQQARIDEESSKQEENKEE